MESAGIEERVAERLRQSLPGATIEHLKKLVMVRVSPGELLKASSLAKAEGFDLFTSVGGVDYPREGKIELIYTVWSTSLKLTLMLRTKVDRDRPVVDSVVDVWPAADWHERETHELLGVIFRGNPNLGPPGSFLLPSPWVWEYPLRKEFKLVWSETWLPQGYSRKPVKPVAKPRPQVRR